MSTISSCGYVCRMSHAPLLFFMSHVVIIKVVYLFVLSSLLTFSGRSTSFKRESGANNVPASSRTFFLATRNRMLILRYQQVLIFLFLCCVSLYQGSMHHVGLYIGKERGAKAVYVRMTTFLICLNERAWSNFTLSILYCSYG